MKRVLYVSVVLFAVTAATAQSIPKELVGKWLIHRELPVSTISCWDEAAAQKIIGTEIEYTTEAFRWKGLITKHPVIEKEVVSAKKFHDENSGGGANDSQVNFKELGITSRNAIQVTLKHPNANVADGTDEIPGDRVLVKNSNYIIFSVCNVYFEAKRLPASAPKKRAARK